MRRLAYSKDDTDAVAHLVANHMRPYGYAASRNPWSDSAIRRFVRDAYLARGERVLADVDMLLKLARADITGSAPRRRRVAEESWRSLKGRVRPSPTSWSPRRCRSSRPQRTASSSSWPSWPMPAKSRPESAPSRTFAPATTTESGPPSASTRRLQDVILATPEDRSRSPNGW